jgi:hypothetical protein
LNFEQIGKLYENKRFKFKDETEEKLFKDFLNNPQPYCQKHQPNKL